MKQYKNGILYHGDCLIVMGKIQDQSIDLILADLPYGTTQAKWDSIIPLKPLWEQYERIIKDNGAILLFSAEPFTSNLVMSNLNLFKYRITWDKIAVTNHLNAKKMPMRQIEDICVFYKKQPTYNPVMTKRTADEEKEFKAKFTGKEQFNEIYGYAKSRPIRKTLERYPTDLITFNAKAKECNGRNRVHATQKPVSLLEYLLVTYSNENDLVLDNVAGSGSTGVACQNTNRRFILIEKEDKYIDIIDQRLEK